MHVAGAVEQHVDAAHLGRQGGDVLAARDVQLEGSAAFQARQQFSVDVRRDHVCAFLGKQFGRCPPYSLRGGGDQGDFPLKAISHYLSLRIKICIDAQNQTQTGTRHSIDSDDIYPFEANQN